MKAAQKTAYLGVMLSLCLILGYVETVLPFNFGIVGFRLGLPNIIILLLLKRNGFKYAICVNFARILIINIVFGSAVSLAFALAAGIASTTVMYFMLKIKSVGFIGVSAAGGTVHNIVQAAVAALILNTAGILHLIPVLMVTGLFTGIFCGIAVCLLYNSLKKAGL